MAELVRPWNDGGSLSVTYNGSGDGEAIFSSDVNEGLDRTVSIWFCTEDESIIIPRRVVQLGEREEFITRDSLIFNTKEEEKFGVIKNYTEVSYLESTGEQYIDLELYPTESVSRTKITFSFSNTTSNYAIFGGRNESGKNSFTLFALNTTAVNGFRFDVNSQNSIATKDAIIFDSAHKYEFEYDGNYASITNLNTAEDKSVYIGPPSTLTSYPVCLFCVNTKGTKSTFLKGKIYSFEYEDGGTKLTLIPVLDSNGVACMYDKVSGKFFYNQGTGNFIAGEILN
jgi:hypothetical protein